MSNEDIMLVRARAFLRDRISKALQPALTEIATFLETSGAVNAHRHDYTLFANALIYDVVTAQRRTIYTPSGSISQSECPSFDEIARSIAHEAAKQALAALGSPQSERAEP